MERTLGKEVERKRKKVSESDRKEENSEKDGKGQYFKTFIFLMLLHEQLNLEEKSMFGFRFWIIYMKQKFIFELCIGSVGNGGGIMMSPNLP